MAADDFNPYHEWLELDAQLKQPNYYQLLGVDQQEVDTQKIAAAADRALSKVRSIRPGARAPEWAKLLDEMAAARHCLTDPTRRAEYDRQLTSQQFAAPTTYRRPTPRDKASPNVEVLNVDSPGTLPMSAPSAAPVQSPKPTMPAGPAAAAYPPAGQPAGPVAEPQMPTQAPVPQGGTPAYPSPMTPTGHMAQSPAAPVAGAPTSTQQGYPAGPQQSTPPGPMQGVPPAGTPPYGTPTGYTAQMPASPATGAPGVPVGGATPTTGAPTGTPQGYPAGSAQPSPAAGQAVQNIPTGVPVAAASPGAAGSASRSPGVQVGKDKSASAMARRRSDLSKSVPLIAVGIGVLILLFAGVLLTFLGGGGDQSGSPSRTSRGRQTPQSRSPVRTVTKPSTLNRKRTGRPPSSAVREYKREREDGNGTAVQPDPSAMVPQPEAKVERGTDRNGAMVDEPQAAPTGTSGPDSQPETMPESDAKPTPEPPTKPVESKDAPPDAKMTPKPDPAARPKPEPTPAPGAEPKREDVEALASAMKAARAALGDYNFDDALAELKKVRSLPKLPEHQAKFDRLDLLAQYAQQFRLALLDAIDGFESGSEIEIGSGEFVVVVSATREQLALRVRGQSRTFAIDDMPPGLAVAVADTWFDKNNAVNLVLKAAYIVSLKKPKADYLAKAREWFQEADKRGVDIGDLVTVIDDTYDLERDLTQ